jgi:hypothetical protein
LAFDLVKSKKEVAVMIISSDRLRIPLIAILAVLFIALTVMVFTGQPIIATLDGLIQEFGTGMVPNWLLIIATPFYWIGHGLVNLLVVFALAFFLWGFKFKIPAAWLFLTNLSGALLIGILSLIFKHHTLRGTSVYPNHETFFVILLAAFLFIIVIPEIQRTWLAWVGRILTVLGVLLVLLKTVFVAPTTLSDAFAGIIFAFLWLLIAEEYYARKAAWYHRFNGFHNSWY